MRKRPQAPTAPPVRTYTAVRPRIPLELSALGCAGRSDVLQVLVTGRDGVTALEQHGEMVRATIGDVVVWTVIDWGIE